MFTFQRAEHACHYLARFRASHTLPRHPRWNELQYWSFIISTHCTGWFEFVLLTQTGLPYLSCIIAIKPFMACIFRGWKACIFYDPVHGPLQRRRQQGGGLTADCTQRTTRNFTSCGEHDIYIYIYSETINRLRAVPQQGYSSSWSNSCDWRGSLNWKEVPNTVGLSFVFFTIYFVGHMLSFSLIKLWVRYGAPQVKS